MRCFCVYTIRFLSALNNLFSPVANSETRKFALSCTNSRTSRLLLALMIPREYNDGPDVTYISCCRKGARGRERVCSARVKLQLVTRSYSWEKIPPLQNAQHTAIGVHELTSIGMLNAAHRRNKELVLFSHLRIAVRRAAPREMKRQWSFPHLLRMEMRGITREEKKHTNYAYYLIVSRRNFFYG